jgi:peptide/nickel transport system substrate-binding protein
MGTPALRAYGFNLRREPVNDLRVRQAIAWALDREVINDRVWFGHSIASSLFLPPTHGEFNQDLLNAYQPRDLAKAEALLDEAGYPRDENGVRFKLRIVFDTRADRADMAIVFKQLVEEIGIEVELDGGIPEYMQDKSYIQHDFDVAVISLGVREPSVGVARIFLSDNIGAAKFNNIAAYVNPEMDELWETYSTIFDPDVRKEAMFRIQELALEELPYIFVNTPTNFAMYDSGEFEDFPEDCSVGYGMMRTFWWKEGQPNP